MKALDFTEKPKSPKTEKTRKIAVCDAETDPFKRDRVPTPFIWGFYDGDIYEEFENTEEFAMYLMGYDGICYAHNGGRFDWHFLLDYATAYDPIMLINGRIAKMMIGDCECRDSINIIPVPLKAMQKEENFDYAILEKEVRHLPENKKRISAYLRSDCENLYKFVSRFVDDYGMNLTQAGAAMKQWKKISKKPLPRSTPEFYGRMAAYYYGGRVECFESGIIETDFEVLDINSAYPFAMLQKHPYSTVDIRKPGFNPEADFYRVQCVSKGALPYRDKSGLIFPNDDELREYTVSKWEYQAALDTQTITDSKVIESISFTEHTDFQVYVDYFYNMRQAAKACGDKAGDLFGKLFMNSLYGKFCANPNNYKDYMIVPMNVIGGLEKCGWHYGGEFGPWGLAQTELPEDQQVFYNVATGASITGYVRAMLWRAICDSKGVMYCDTDSIAVRRRGAGIEIGGQLGNWKDEGAFCRAGIAGKKLYIFESDRFDNAGSRICKSASKGARLTNDEIWQVAAGEIVDYAQEAPTFSPRKEPSFIKRKIRKTVDV